MILLLVEVFRTNIRPQARQPGNGPNYYCQGSAELVTDRGAWHVTVGGQTIDAAVAGAYSAAGHPPPSKPA